jgi:hypothetical protein
MTLQASCNSGIRLKTKSPTGQPKSNQWAKFSAQIIALV